MSEQLGLFDWNGPFAEYGFPVDSPELGDVARARRVDGEASRAAAEFVEQSGRAGGQAARVFSFIAAFSLADGPTGYEIAAGLGDLSQVQVLRRIGDLTRRGLVLGVECRACTVRPHSRQARWLLSPRGRWLVRIRESVRWSVLAAVAVCTEWGPASEVELGAYLGRDLSRPGRKGDPLGELLERGLVGLDRRAMALADFSGGRFLCLTKAGREALGLE